MEERREWMDWLHAGVSPWHTVRRAEMYLCEQGFVPLELTEPFAVEPGGRYVVADGSFLAAFTLGNREEVRVAAAHTDWPCLRVKARPELLSAGCCRLNVEPYGGMLYSTWMDRPLGLAGVVYVKTADPLRPAARLIRWDEPLLVIPNLAIHLDRNANNGKALLPQTDLLPLCRLAEEGWEKEGYLVGQIAQKLGVAPEEVLSFELCAYCMAPPVRVGFDKGFLSSPRLDNITSVMACVEGLAKAAGDTLNVAVLYDNEEIGSTTYRGGDSATLSVILEKLAEGLGWSRTKLADARRRGMLLSCDAAHAVHPNHPELADPTCGPLLGRGLALKRSPRYSSDAGTCAVVQGLCQSRSIPWQEYRNRADQPGGSTVGAMASARLAMPAVDVGVPLLAMHSACELMAAADQEALNRLCRAFFEA